MQKIKVKISVIMPVYNTEKYVGQAIESILSQSFTDFEFIIIDDCSTDKSYEICKKYAEQDSRIKLFKNDSNIGVVKTRNKLLFKVSPESKYIAIMDADDVSRKDRLEKQFNFLEKNKNISLLGSDISIINENTQQVGFREYPHSFKEIKRTIFHKSPLAQPSVMIRKSDLESVGNYNEDFERCQDYELWFRFYDLGYKISNIPEKLLLYRVFLEQGKSKHLKLTLKNTIKIQKKYIFQKKYIGFGNLSYYLAENILLFFPKSFILWIFKKLEYKNV